MSKHSILRMVIALSLLTGSTLSAGKGSFSVEAQWEKEEATDYYRICSMAIQSHEEGDVESVKVKFNYSGGNPTQHTGTGELTIDSSDKTVTANLLKELLPIQPEATKEVKFGFGFPNGGAMAAPLPTNFFINDFPVQTAQPFSVGAQWEKEAATEDYRTCALTVKNNQAEPADSVKVKFHYSSGNPTQHTGTGELTVDSSNKIVTANLLKELLPIQPQATKEIKFGFGFPYGGAMEADLPTDFFVNGFPTAQLQMIKKSAATSGAAISDLSKFLGGNNFALVVVTNKEKPSEVNVKFN